MLGSSIFVDRVFVGNGSSDGRKNDWKKLCGATGLYGGNETFWPISEQALQIWLSSFAALPKITSSSTMTAEKKIDMQKRLLTKVLEWKQKNQSVPIVLWAVGARSHIRNMRQFQIHEYGPNASCRNDGRCVLESVANGVAALTSPKNALNVAKYF